MYRVTHHVGQNLLLTSKTKVLFWLGLPWTSQAEAERLFLKSMGGFGQRDGSPCIWDMARKLTGN